MKMAVYSTCLVKLMGYPAYFEDTKPIICTGLPRFSGWMRVLGRKHGTVPKIVSKYQCLCYAVRTWIVTFTLLIAHLVTTHGILTHGLHWASCASTPSDTSCPALVPIRVVRLVVVPPLVVAQLAPCLQV